MINRVGFRRKAGDTTEYLILPESFRAEVVKGFSQKRAARVLDAAGWLRCGQGRNTVLERLPGMGVSRVYALRLPEK